MIVYVFFLRIVDEAATPHDEACRRDNVVRSEHSSSEPSDTARCRLRFRMGLSEAGAGALLVPAGGTAPPAPCVACSLAWAAPIAEEFLSRCALAVSR